MLGGGAANWRGTIDGQPPTTIGKYEGAQAKYMMASMQILPMVIKGLPVIMPRSSSRATNPTSTAAAS